VAIPSAPIIHREAAAEIAEGVLLGWTGSRWKAPAAIARPRAISTRIQSLMKIVRRLAISRSAGEGSESFGDMADPFIEGSADTPRAGRRPSIHKSEAGIMSCGLLQWDMGKAARDVQFAALAVVAFLDRVAVALQEPVYRVGAECRDAG
jgi:hypothetical protein